MSFFIANVDFVKTMISEKPLLHKRANKQRLNNKLWTQPHAPVSGLEQQQSLTLAAGLATHRKLLRCPETSRLSKRWSSLVDSRCLMFFNPHTLSDFATPAINKATIHKCHLDQVNDLPAQLTTLVRLPSLLPPASLTISTVAPASVLEWCSHGHQFQSCKGSKMHKLQANDRHECC